MLVEMVARAYIGGSTSGELGRVLFVMSGELLEKLLKSPVVALGGVI
jgi:hypothetical protein